MEREGNLDDLNELRQLAERKVKSEIDVKV
jgi:hypothetical protein